MTFPCPFLLPGLQMRWLELQQPHWSHEATRAGPGVSEGEAARSPAVLCSPGLLTPKRTHTYV